VKTEYNRVKSAAAAGKQYIVETEYNRVKKCRSYR